MTADGNGYFGTYCLLDDTSGSSHVRVSGDMVVIGAPLDFTSEVHVTDRGKEVPRIIVSRGQNALGFLPANVYKRVAKLLDDGWTCHAYPSVSIFNKLEDRYITEVALICYAPQHAEVYAVFEKLIASRIAKGEHPSIALSDKDAARVLESDGQWAQTGKAALPALKKGMALYKTKQTSAERMALAAARGNKGCYVGLAAVVIVIIVAVYLLFFR